LSLRTLGKTSLVVLAAALSGFAATEAAHGQTIDPACESQCLTTYYACSDQCAQYGGAVYGCDESCQNSLDSCIHYCPTCPRSRSYSRDFLTGYLTIPGTTACLSESTASVLRPRIRQKVTPVYQRVTYRETTQCNGSVTTTETGRQNISGAQCWTALGSQNCSPVNLLPFLDLLCPF